MTEREAIVAWLREEAGVVIGRLCSSVGYITELAERDAELIESVAGRIERGDHLSKPEQD